MATLTETAYYTRRILAVGGILLIGFIVLRISFNLTKNIWLKLNPPPPPPPTVSFGKLPKIKFPEETPDGKPKPELAFRLETIGGGLPSLPDVSRVYFMPTGRPNLLALERTKQRVQKMGFRGKSEAIDATTYRWTSQDIPPTTLEMDIYTGKFHLRYPYETDQELLANKNLPTTQQAADETKSFLSNNQLLSDDLEQGKIEFSYWGLTPSGLISAISLSEADFIRVDIFRSGLDELEIFPPDTKESLVSFLFSGSRESTKRIIEIKYVHSPIEKETFGTYPLKSIATAWQELQGGEGHIANLGQNKNGQITIRRVSLAYYESVEAQNYLQPIYVFEGDGEFFAYIPAIDSEWTEQ